MVSLISAATCYIGSHLIARAADQGLAHTLGLTTLRHGTNPLSWLSIHTIGFFPSMGGSKIGGDATVRKEGKVVEQNINNIFFATDADDYDKSQGGYLIDRFLMRLLPRTYCYSGCLSLINSTGLFTEMRFNEESNKVITLRTTLVKTSIAISSLFIPTIKVRMDPDETKKLIPDDDIGNNVAASTDKWVSPLNIGLAGTLWNGLSYKVFKRIYNNPTRIITGIALLAISSAAAYTSVALFPTLILANKVAVIAGVALAVI